MKKIDRRLKVMNRNKFTKDEKDRLEFILFEFIRTHEAEQDIYQKDLDVAGKMIKALK
jgi:hypothetical protein